MFYQRVNEHLELRLLNEAHVTRLHQLISRNRVRLRQWLPWVEDTRTLDDTRRFIRFGLRQYAKRNGMHAGVWYDNELAGIISFNYIDLGRQQTEIGYWLGENFEGHGIMTAACRVMVDYAFEQLKLRVIEIRCAVANVRSRAIPERLGFELHGTVPQLDWLSEAYIDTVVYRMTAQNWHAQEEV